MTSVGRLPRGPWRGGGRTAAWLCGALVVGALTYMWHGAHVHLGELREAASKCMQHQEVLAAQMEVVVEYKLRLEKSLQQEKNDHRHTRESLQARAEEERSLRERQSLEASNRYSSLQQQYKILQGQHGDLEEETQKLRTERLEWLERKSGLEASVSALQQQLTQLRASKAAELQDLKTQFSRLEQEHESLTKRHGEALAEVRSGAARLKEKQRDVDRLSQDRELLQQSKPSTPQINPMAVLSRERVAQPAAAAPPPLQHEGEGEAEADNEEREHAPAADTRPRHEEGPALAAPPDEGTNVGAAPPLGPADHAVGPAPPQQKDGERQKDGGGAREREEAAEAEAEAGRHYDVPQGVVPAPHGYVLQREEPAAGEDENDEGGGVGIHPLARAGYPWRPPFMVGPGPQPRRPQAQVQAQPAPRGLRPRDGRREEAEEEPLQQQQEEEDEDAGGGGGGDYLQEPARGEDDDMDHIDYNEGAQQRQGARGGAGRAGAQPAGAAVAGVREPPLPVGPRDSVMVNPKK
ncbi:Golgi integral membrane protein 4-like [Schistocerca piceifrons]|uniref:Golgi integral membrane protein 4-like n=1 Tax=Schistocerca piceifrons TaxID=274613 RepID=UPI001F5FC748|nr:Golgi integral membrane protein 4-like [Schistocerca piceifrons]